MKIQTLTALLRTGKKYGQLKSKNLEISTTENSICVCIYLNRHINQDGIASSMGVDKATVAKALLKLEQKQMVRREVNPQNRRENRLTLTPQGLKKIAQVLHLQQEWEEQVSACLTLQEQIAFEAISEKLLLHAKKLLEEEENDG